MCSQQISEINLGAKVGDGWIVNLQNLFPYLYAIKNELSQDELLKYEKIRNQEKKNLFCLRKGIVRILVGGYLGIRPKEVQYDYNSYGKPFILNIEGRGLGFNISHSKEYLFVGLVENRDIGVDIEKFNLNIKHSLLAGMVFSNKELALYNLYKEEEKVRAFYKAWVQKEAISKAIGIGISMGFNNLTVNIDPDLNNEEYFLEMDSLGVILKMKVEVKSDYVFATAVIDRKDENSRNE